MYGATERILVGDIGGTRARFALAGGGGRLSHQRVLSAAEYPTLVDAADHYLEGIGEARPVEGALALACPVLDDRVELTNQAWTFSIRAARESLGFRVLEALNDLSAIALSLPVLEEEDTQTLREGAESEGPIGVLGIGTGLGFSALLSTASGERPLASEGGHQEFAATNEREWEIARLLRERFGRVSLERVLSGPGLVNLYTAIQTLRGAEPILERPEAVAARARARECPASMEALEIFAHQLGVVAGDLALTYGATGGVYIGGGVVPGLLDILDVKRFREAFEAKGRFRGYVDRIPVRLIVNPNAGLIGASRAIEPSGSG